MPAQDTKPTSSEQTHILLEWSASERPFRQRSQEYFKTIAALVFLICVILFFAKEYVLIGAVLSVAFVAYVLASVPPGETKHKITNLGVDSSNHFHRWEEFEEYWIDQSHGQKMLVMQIVHPYPSRLFMMLGGVEEDKVKQLLSKHIPYREHPQYTFVDKATKWLGNKVPLEKPIETT